jgi:hypothetical protein
VATVSNAFGSQGLAVSASVGTTTLTATDPGSGTLGTTTLTVSGAVLVSLAVTPADPSIALGFTQAFTATGTFSDATTQDLTTSVTWGSSAPGVATISNAAGSEGLATSAALGATTITATDPGTGTTGSTTLTITAAVLLSIQVTPAAPTVLPGSTQAFTATGTYSDASTLDLTTGVTWSSSDTGIATLSNAVGSQGLASTISAGTTTVTATHAGSGISGTTTLTVSDGIVLRAASSAGAGNNVTSLTVAVPSGTAADDVMLAGIAVRATSPTITAPAGWTLVRLSANATGNANSLAIYRRVAGASEPANYTWTFSASRGSAGAILSFEGVDTTNPIDAEDGDTTPSALSHTAPSVTTTSASTMLVTFHDLASRASWTPPTGMNEAADVASGAVPSNAGVSLSAHWLFLSTAGSTGARTAIASNSADTGNACSVALRN